MADDPRPQRSILGAALWMAGAVFSFITLAISGRVATKYLSTSEVLLFRAIITIALVIALTLVVTGSLSAIRTSRPGLQVLRNVFQFGGQFFWLYGLPLIPLAQLFALEFTVPLWVAVLAPLILGERITWARAGVAFLGFVGVMVVLRPGLQTINIGSLSVLVCAIGFALSMICTKALARTDHPFAVLFYMGILQLPIALALSWPVLKTPPNEAWPALVAVTLSGMFAHYCMMRAMKLADAVTVAPLDFMRVPLVAIIGVLLYNEPFDLVVLAGGAIILAANVLSVRSERKLERQEASAPAAS